MPTVERIGISLHYESYGTGAPLVFLHPLSTNRYFWAQQIFAFARDHHVLVADLRGHGLSGKPSSGYAVDEMAADVIAILDGAGIDGAVLVGDSLGGMIALQVALDAPERVNALVIVSSGTNLGAEVPDAVLEAYASRFEAAFEFMLRGSTSATTKAERPEVCAYLDAAFRIDENFSASTFLACIRDPRGVFQWNVSERLGEIGVPALVLAGAEDQAIPLAVVRGLAEGIGSELKLVPEVGHYYPLERPAEFNTDLRAFLHEAETGGAGRGERI
jgi:pimeloyl-ACP methyl ester carboxylesterase